MRRRVSARERAALPLSLMVRLERMAQGQSWEAAGEGLEEAPQEPQIEQRDRWTFGLGAFAGVVIAGAAFLGAAVFELQKPPHNPRLSAANPPPAKADPRNSATSTAKGVQPVVFEIAIDRSRAGPVPFGLQLAGSDASDIQVVLSNLPPAASLSHGQRRGDSTWTVNAAELGQLHLALQDDAPEMFDVRIDVLAPPSMAVAPSIAKVRLVGAGPAAKIAVAEARTEPSPEAVDVAAVPEPPAAPPKLESSVQGKTAEAGKAAAPQPKRPPPVLAHAGSAGKQGLPAQPGPPPWTQAPSALGATARGEWDRQVWWQLPLPFWPPVVESPPAWSPFLDPPAHR